MRGEWRQTERERQVEIGENQQEERERWRLESCANCDFSEISFPIARGYGLNAHELLLYLQPNDASQTAAATAT